MIALTAIINQINKYKFKDSSIKFQVDRDNDII